MGYFAEKLSELYFRIWFYQLKKNNQLIYQHLDVVVIRNT